MHLLVTIVLVLVNLSVYVLIAPIPSWIAASRNHSKVNAIRVCGLVGLITGIAWLVAVIWAYHI